MLGYVWVDQSPIGDAKPHAWPFRRIDRRFTHLSSASLGIVFRLDRAAALYTGAASAFGTAVTEHRPTNLQTDLGLHLDSMFVYLRVLADIVAAATPYFYSSALGDLPSSSFREHIKWFVTRRPDFDPDYSAAIAPHLDWFELLAGKEGRGIRELLIHRFAYYQHGVIVDPPEQRGTVTPGLITERGFAHQDVTALLRDIVAGLCSFLDAFVSHHAQRILATGWEIIEPSLPHSCQLYNFMSLPRSAWLFPVRRRNGNPVNELA